MTDRIEKNSIKPENDPETKKARRKFLKRAGQVAVTTPAVTLLLAANGRRANAGLIGSDFTDFFEDTGKDPEGKGPFGPNDTGDANL